MELWQRYVSTYPETDFVKKAKLQQAQLYYQQAKKKQDKEMLLQAMQFYLRNYKLLMSVAPGDTIQKQMEDLSAMLRRTKTR